MKTFASLFSGFGGADLGAIAAGLTEIWGIELMDDIAAVARTNGLNVMTADILECDPGEFEAPDYLHASPPCPNFSNAKANGEETAADIALAEKVAEFIAVLLPTFFTLENVYQYRNSQSWETIARALLTHGYQFNYWHVNTADYGGLVRCPIHHVLELTQKNVSGAEMYLSHVSKMKTAPDIAQQSAAMSADAQARILAWDAVVGLAQQIPLDIVGNVTLKLLAKKLQKIKPVQITHNGRVDDLLMNVVISELGTTEKAQDMYESIALLLKRCLEESCERERLFTISTEILEITVRKILGCLLTIPFTFQNTMKRQTSQKDGDQVTGGNDCPMCRYTAIPQTRKRMIVIARRDGIKPMLPPATHAENPVNGLFGKLGKWVGWYEAIEDLIPALPESKFAKWQMERLPEEIKTFMINGAGNTNFSEAYPGRGCLEVDKPAHTVITITEAGGNFPKALIVDGRNSNQEWGKLFREGQEPTTAVTVLERPAHYPRAFIVDQQNGSRDSTYRIQSDPIFTTTQYSTKHPPPRAYTSGRVVQMTPRALARFQSFPDCYELPKQKRLACKGIGNAVPPLFMQRLYEAIQ